MRNLVIFTIVIIVGILAFLFFGFYNKEEKPVSQIKIEKTEKVKITMKITSAAFDHNQKIPSKYTCDGENKNPPLAFVEVPEEAKSLVLIVDDPDAQSKTWVHWVVYNINSSVTEIEESAVPEEAIEGMTDFGTAGYGGPCPPSGTHRYFFKLYALDTTLGLPENATKQMVEEKMEDYIVAKAELIGFYSRE